MTTISWRFLPSCAGRRTDSLTDGNKPDRQADFVAAGPALKRQQEQRFRVHELNRFAVTWSKKA